MSAAHSSARSTCTIFSAPKSSSLDAIPGSRCARAGAARALGDFRRRRRADRRQALVRAGRRGAESVSRLRRSRHQPAAHGQARAGPAALPAMSTTRLFPLALMLALALLTLWLDHQVRFEVGGHPSLRRHDPDYLVTNFTTTTYNREGNAETVLAAAQMQHYPDADSTDVSAPRRMQTKPP